MLGFALASESAIVVAMLNELEFEKVACFTTLPPILSAIFPLALVG